MQRQRAYWATEGACVGAPIGLFTEKQTKVMAKIAKEICDSCPVIEECRKYALVHERGGFWGGLTQLQLKRLRSQILSTLGYEAYSEGWLEPEVNLISPKMLAEFAEIAKLKSGTEKYQALKDLHSVAQIPDLSEIQIEI